MFESKECANGTKQVSHTITKKSYVKIFYTVAYKVLCQLNWVVNSNDKKGRRIGLLR